MNTTAHVMKLKDLIGRRIKITRTTTRGTHSHFAIIRTVLPKSRQVSAVLENGSLTINGASYVGFDDIEFA